METLETTKENKAVKITIYQPERNVSVKMGDKTVTRKKGGFNIELEVTPHHKVDLAKNGEAVSKQLLHKFYSIIEMQLKTGQKIMQLTEPILFKMQVKHKVLDLGEASLKLGMNVKWGKKAVQRAKFNNTIKSLVNVSMGSLSKWATDADMLNIEGAVDNLINVEALARQAAKEAKEMDKTIAETSTSEA